MKLTLIVRNTKTQTNPASPEKVIQLDNAQALVGSHQDCDLILNPLPPVAFMISPDENGKLVLTRKHHDHPLLLNGQELSTATTTIPNGSKISTGDYEIQLFTSFPPAPTARSFDLHMSMAIALLVIIVLLQFAIMLYLPGLIRIAHSEGITFSREQLYYKIDTLRNQITVLNDQFAKHPPSPYALEVLQLYKEEADRMAMYLRQYAKHLSAEELKQFHTWQATLRRQITLLQQGKLIPPPQPLPVTSLIQNILEPAKQKKLFNDSP